MSNRKNTNLDSDLLDEEIKELVNKKINTDLESLESL
jgi:hypothetical protein